MKTTVSRYDFHRAFETIRPDNFTYDGIDALFDYFEALEEDLGEEIELDVIGICCGYSEYTDLAAFQADYGEEYETMEDIQDRTTVIDIDGEAFIIQQF